MFIVLHHDTVKTEIRTSLRPMGGNNDEEALLGEIQIPALTPSNHSDDWHVREASNRWSSPGDKLERDCRDSAQSSTPTLHSASVGRVKSLQPLAMTAESSEDNSSEEEDMDERRLSGV